jgi:hypothetical protein
MTTLDKLQASDRKVTSDLFDPSAQDFHLDGTATRVLDADPNVARVHHHL